MSQNFTDDCYAATHVRATDLQAFENNFAALKSSFSGSSAPSNAVAGMLWYDTSTGFLKVRNTDNTTWISIYDVVNDVVPSNKVVLASLINGILTADATGRAKMADLFVTNAKINDVSGSKITDNTISSAKYQDNSVNTTKLAPGVSTLWNWTCGHYAGQYVDFSDGGEKETSCSFANIGTSTYKKMFYNYLYIPSTCKYVVLAVRAGSQSYSCYIRFNCNGTAGSLCSPKYNSGLQYAVGATLDISAQGGAWRPCYIEVIGVSGSPGVYISSFNVTWYGA